MSFIIWFSKLSISEEKFWWNKQFIDQRRCSYKIKQNSFWDGNVWMKWKINSMLWKVKFYTGVFYLGSRSLGALSGFNLAAVLSPFFSALKWKQFQNEDKQQKLKSNKHMSQKAPFSQNQTVKNYGKSSKFIHSKIVFLKKKLTSRHCISVNKSEGEERSIHEFSLPFDIFCFVMWKSTHIQPCF